MGPEKTGGELRSPTPPAQTWRVPIDADASSQSSLTGLVGVEAGGLALALLPERCGLAGYLIPVAVMTAGYSLFQTANNTAVMHGAAPNQRGLVSGLLNLSRNLGLLTGASLLGGVFALATQGAVSPSPGAVALATRVTFSGAVAFIAVALILALRAKRPEPVDSRARPTRGEPS